MPLPALGQVQAVDGIVDTVASSALISSATTTTLIAGVGGQTIRLWRASWYSAGSETAATVNLEWGNGAGCPSPTVLNPVALTGGAVTNILTNLWGVLSTFNANGSPNGNPGIVPMIIPAGFSVCGVTAGTLISGRFTVGYTQY